MKGGAIKYTDLSAKRIMLPESCGRTGKIDLMTKGLG